MFVEDYMTKDPVAVREDAAISAAAEIMRRHHFRHLPVVDANGRLTGILSDRDVRGASGCNRAAGGELTVGEVMTPDPLTVPMNAALEEAVRLLIEHRFGALPVMCGERLVGIITYVDALRALARVFGLDEPGQRIEVALPEGFADMARAFAALRDCNGSLLSAVVSRTRRDGGEPALYLRVTPDQARVIERRLRAATLILLEPEHD